MPTNIAKLDQRILGLLWRVAQENCEHQTLWLNADAIAGLVDQGATRSKRKVVRSRLKNLERQGAVESRRFDTYVAWKIAEREL